MKRLAAVLAAGMLLLAGACDNAREVADDAEDVAQDAADEVRDAADNAEDVINDRQIQIDNFAYEPKSRSVTLGTEVTWLNQDDAQHTVTSNNDSFKSNNLEEGDEFSYRFTQRGDYKYHCVIHGEDRMSGTITVE